MKKMTCRDLRGSCDVEITGETPEEMGENCKKHVMGLMANGDHSHDEAMEKMTNLSDEERKQWMVDFEKKFQEAPEV
jgi:gluconate kinase